MGGWDGLSVCARLTPSGSEVVVAAHGHLEREPGAHGQESADTWTTRPEERRLAPAFGAVWPGSIPFRHRTLILMLATSNSLVTSPESARSPWRRPRTSIHSPRSPMARPEHDDVLGSRVHRRYLRFPCRCRRAAGVEAEYKLSLSSR